MVEDKKVFNDALIAHFRGEEPRLRCEYRYHHADGTIHWARQHGVAQFDDNGRAVRMVGSTGDITAEMEAREEADRAREQLVEAIEAISEGFALFDGDNCLVLCNSTYRGYFSETVGEEIAAKVQPGTPFETFARAAFELGIYPDIEEDFDTYYGQRDSIRDGAQRTSQYRLKDGRWLQISDHNTQDGGRAAVFTDITDVKKREAELNDLVDSVAEARDEADRSRGQLVEAIEAISEGFVFFDTEDRIVICNSNFRQFFADAVGDDLAEMVQPGVAFSTFARLSFERGMFPDITEDAETYITNREERHKNPHGAMSVTRDMSGLCTR